MKIQILSDTHNECGPAPFLPTRTEAEVVVLAGDIGWGEDSFRWARNHFPEQRVVMVAGNHEAWGREWHGLVQQMRLLAARYAIDFLENDTVMIDGVRFIGATLFTDMMLFGAGGYETALAQAQRIMPDFQRIRLASPNRFLRLLGVSDPMYAEDSVALHRASRAYIESRLADSFPGPVVVVSHHAPSRQSIETRFADDPLSPCFVSSLDELIAASRIALWIHGHTHAAFDYRINRTRVVCNAVGYRDRDPEISPTQRHGFRPELVVEI